MRIPLPAAVAVALIGGPVASANPLTPVELARRVDAYVEPLLADEQLSGSLLIARGDEILLERSWGYANYEHAVPNTPDTPTLIASVTKPMTIALVCRLMEQGVLLPDQTLAEWIPDFPRAKEITVAHLLNHRATIPHRVTEPRDEVVPRTAADMVELAKHAEPLPHAPGEVSVYSSAGFSVLARLIELVSGRSYPDALRELVLEPAGMTHSGHADSRQLVPGRASAYLWDGTGVVNAPLKDTSFLVGAGSVLSTPRDLHRLVRALVDGRLGAVAQVNLVREHGLSWNGVTSGFRAFVEYDREADTLIAFTANLLTGAGEYLHRDLPRLVAGETVDVPPRLDLELVSVPETVLRRYTGIYRDSRSKELDLHVQGGALWAKEWQLLPTSETTFFCAQDHGRVRVVFDADGVPEAIEWMRIEGPWEWKRVGDLPVE